MEVEKQKQFTFEGKVVISSKFQSGNLSQAIQKAPNHYNLWIGSDHNSTYKTWFYFSIEGIDTYSTVTFSINNMSNQLKLFKEDHLPVFRQQNNENWERIKIPIQQNGIVKSQDGYQLTFKHTFTKNCKHYFAFSYPYTTSECDNFINKLISNNSQKMFASYEKMALTPCKRNMNILTFTKLIKNYEWKQIQLFQQQSTLKPMIFQGKKGIFISARVHPGQVASSHILNGILNELFNFSQKYNKLLQKFVFYVIPIINPDGVDQGNFRTDSKGKNLNRYYTNPNKYQEPEIYTIKKFLLQMINKGHIQFCLDLHAHVNKQGAFIYGNCIQDLKGQLQVCLFPKILAFNSPYFDYDACNFSEKNMSSKDKSDQLSKQGASRVAIFKQTGLKACWTLECNYNSCKYINQLNNTDTQNLKSVSNGVLTQKLVPLRKQQKVFFNIKQFHQLGKGICESIEDYYSLKSDARFYSGKIKNRDNFMINMAVEVLRMIPFRFDNNCRKILMGINSNMNLSEHLNTLKQLVTGISIGKYPKIQIREGNNKKEELKQNRKQVVRNATSESENNKGKSYSNKQVHSVSNKSVQKSQNKIPSHKFSSKAMQLAKIGIPISRKLTVNKTQQNKIGIKSNIKRTTLNLMIQERK